MTDATTIEPDDLRGSLSAAFDEAVEATPAPTPALKAEAAPQPVEAPDGRQRDEHGRFAPKGIEAQKSQTIPDQPVTQQTTEAPEPIRPPAAWSAAAKSAFLKADPVIQQEALKREADMDAGLRERADQLKRYEPLDQVLAPYKAKLAMRGVSEAQAVQALLAAQDVLEQNPVNGLLQLAQHYRINPAELGQALMGAQGQQPQLHPALAPLVQEIQTLKSTLAQQQQRDSEASRGAVMSEIEKFASDPKHVYFPNVKDRMAALLASKQADTLDQAYEQACYIDPDIRKLIQADQSASGQGVQQQRAKVSAAKLAGGSVTGGPSPGSGPANGHAIPSIRESLEEAYSQT